MEEMDISVDPASNTNVGTRREWQDCQAKGYDSLRHI